MARISIPFLVRKPHGDGTASWYWQPSATLRREGWTPLSLGKHEGQAIAAAQARNADVDRWKSGTAALPGVATRAESGTLAAGIARYRREVLAGARPNGQPVLAPATVKVYRTPLDRLEAWAGKHPIAYVTPRRVEALRDALLRNLGHHPAFATLKMGRTLWKWFVRKELATANPFANFDLAAPDPRQVVWSPAAREAMVLAACDQGMPSVALAILLGFGIGQREEDILALVPHKYRPLTEHLVQPEDFATLRALAPDDVPMAIRLNQLKTRAWVEVPVLGATRALLEHTIERARAAGLIGVILDDTRGPQLYAGAAGQTRFQRDFAEIREWAVAAAGYEGDHELAEELATLQFRDLRRTCVVYLGELGMDAHLIAGVTGHDIDETQKILKTYMPRTTGRAARAISLAAAREAKQAAGQAGEIAKPASSQ